MARSGYRFTNPDNSESNTSYGRPGIREDLAEGLPERLVMLNGIHDDLTEEDDLSPFVEAIRRSTDGQFETARHLVIHALERVERSASDRRFTLSRDSKALGDDGAYRSYFRVAADGVYRGYDAPEGRDEDAAGAADERMEVLGSRGPSEFVVKVAEEIRGVAPIALARLRRNPTSARCGRAVGELALAAAEAAIMLRGCAAEDPAFVGAADAAEAFDADFGAKVQAFRDGVGPEYAAAVAADVPDRASILSAAEAGVASMPEVRGLGHAYVKSLIADLGGSSENLVHWAFNSRSGRGFPQAVAEPEPLPSDEVARLREAAASVLEAYDDANHRPGFVGYLTQALYAAPSGYRPPVGDVCCAMETGRFLRRVSAALAGRPVREESGRMTFRRDGGGDVSYAASDDGAGRETVENETSERLSSRRAREASVLVARFDDEDADDPVCVFYPRTRNTTVRDAALMVAFRRDVLDVGIPGSEEALSSPHAVGGSNFMSFGEAVASMTDPRFASRVVPGRAVSSVGFSSDPVEEPALGMAPA